MSEKKLDEMGAAAMGVNGPVGPDDDDLAEAEIIRLPMHTEAALRAMVRKKLAEVVRKKGGKFVLYAPNKGGKKKAKSIASFETKEAAKNAERLRYPKGKDPAAKKSSKKEEVTVESLAEQASKELLEQRILGEAIKKDLRRMVEAQLPPENAGSDWDEFIGKLGSRVVQGDKAFTRRQNAIKKASDIAVQAACRQVAKALRGIAKVKEMGLKSGPGGESYTGLSIQTQDGAVIEPVMIGIQDGRVQVEFGDGAKAALTRATPETARAIRGELAAIQDTALGTDGVKGAMAKRDRYLDRMEAQVDEMLAAMSPMQISILKNLLVKKYRKAT